MLNLANALKQGNSKGDLTPLWVLYTSLEAGSFSSDSYQLRIFQADPCDILMCISTILRNSIACEHSPQRQCSEQGPPAPFDKYIVSGNFGSIVLSIAKKNNYQTKTDHRWKGQDSAGSGHPQINALNTRLWQPCRHKIVVIGVRGLAPGHCSKKVQVRQTDQVWYHHRLQVSSLAVDLQWCYCPLHYVKAEVKKQEVLHLYRWYTRTHTYIYILYIYIFVNII